MKKIDQSVATREFHVCFVFYVHHIVMSAERDLIFQRYQNALVWRRNLIPRNQNEVLIRLFEFLPSKYLFDLTIYVCAKALLEKKKTLVIAYFLCNWRK